MKTISEIAKEFGLKPSALHRWEDNDLLGDVFKDPTRNNARVYNDEQVERIKLIISEQKKLSEIGINKLDYQKMRELIVDEFGGEIVEKEHFYPVGSIEKMLEMISIQQKAILDMQEQMKQMQQQRLIGTVDHSDDLNEIKNLLCDSQIREEQLLKKVEELEEKVNKKKTFWKFW